MNNHERLICIDYGARFIGLAVADFPGITARALPTLDRQRTDMLRFIGEKIREEKVTRILLGFPFSDNEGEIHKQIRAFRDALNSAFPGIPVDFADESWSSQEADALQSETRSGKKKKGRTQDSEAAKLVLLRYLRGHESS